MRARDLRNDLGAFTTRDPLDGVAGTTTYTNPYHYADNDPIGRIDPLGLRARDSQIDPCGVVPCFEQGPPPVERWSLAFSQFVNSGSTVSVDLSPGDCALFRCDVRVEATFAAGEFVGGGFVTVDHWMDSSQSFADRAFFGPNGRTTVMQFRRRPLPGTLDEQRAILSEIGGSGSLRAWFNGDELQTIQARVEVTVRETSLLARSAGQLTSPSLYLIEIFYNRGKATPPAQTPFEVETGG